MLLFIIVLNISSDVAIGPLINNTTNINILTVYSSFYN